MVSQTELVLR